MTDLLTFGETMLALRGVRTGRLALRDRLEVAVAGAESNVAVGVARLGHAVDWVGHVGDDEAGTLVQAALQGEGIRVTGRIDAARPTGLLLRTARTAALTRVTYHRAGSAGSALAPHDLDEALDHGPRLVHATGITAALSASARAAVLHAARRARQAGAAVSFDVNFRSRLTDVTTAGELLAELLPLIDVLFCGDDELPVLAAALGRAEIRVDDLPEVVPELVVKRGPRGAVALAGGTSIAVDAVPVRAIDLIGAGDAFAGGYLSARLDGQPVTSRLRRGAAVAAYCVSADGDWENLPTRDELCLHGTHEHTDR